MAGGSNKHMIGLIRVEKDPEWSESKMIAEIQGNQVDVQQRTYWEKNVDKQSGSYTKFTGKDKVVSGERFVEKSTGRVGYKDEYEKSSTVKIGDNDGYTEYYCEEKVKRVIYGKKPSPTTPTQNTTRNTTSISSPLILAPPFGRGDIIIVFLLFGICYTSIYPSS